MEYTFLKKYVGIPFLSHGRDERGCDCWGLCCLLYRNEFGIFLPTIDGVYEDAVSRLDAAKGFAASRHEEWSADVTAEPPKPFDFLVFRRGGVDFHVGMWISDGMMLHAEQGAGVSVSRYDVSAWSRMLNRRLRHERFC